MLGPAEILYPLIWQLLPQTLRERLSAAILSFQGRTGNSVPNSDVVVFARAEPLRRQFQASLFPAAPEMTAALPRYSLLSTCLNERDSIGAWLDSVLSQHHLPSEVIITDGGSRDGTPEEIERWKSEAAPKCGGTLPFELRIVKETKCNIAEGRNRAAADAKEELIAFTDAGCELDRFWAQRLFEPFGSAPDVEVSMGWYRAITDGEFETAVAKYIVPQIDAIDPRTFLPSGRSIALRKSVFVQTGGYPEFLTLAGEDSLFDYYLKCHAKKFAFVPEALAFWRFPRSLPGMFRTVKNYARGDAEGGKVFWLYYSNLLRAFGLLNLELVLYLFFYLLYDLTGAGLFLIFAWVFGLSVLVRYLAVIFRYNPFAQAGLLSRDGAINFLAVQMVVWAQVSGFLRGLSSRGAVERRRMELGRAGHALIFVTAAPLLGEMSPTLDRIREFLGESYLVTVVCSSFPKTSGGVVFEHQFVDHYLRSAFQVEAWSEKFLPVLRAMDRDFVVLDLVRDSLSRTYSEELLKHWGGK